MYHKSSIKTHPPPLPPGGGGLFISNSCEERGLIETGGNLRGGAYLIWQRQWYQFSLKN